MAGVGKVGSSLVGPGVDIGPGIPNILVEMQPISVVGDLVAPHGEPPHTAATILSGSATVLAMGRPVTAVGLSTASCAHTMVVGAATVIVGI
jgi:uncharacterized Zn-binding protein involved in type VI secretion|tara:strand:+ start:1141 stop:1416 length:276 start_codon:yes stop_codon:yes gene_type:complete